MNGTRESDLDEYNKMNWRSPSDELAAAVSHLLTITKIYAEELESWLEICESNGWDDSAHDLNMILKKDCPCHECRRD